jgi:hypothetical protein
MRMGRFVQVSVLALLGMVAALGLCEKAYAQCGLPELVKGAERYNQLVCKASSASRAGNNTKALDLLLEASKQPVLESPNIRLFGAIAKSYAKLGRFDEADQYVKYDDLSILWMIGIVRCQAASDSTDEHLFQDGKALTGDDAKHMATVLCGPVFDEFSYFRDRHAESFVPAAKAILQHSSLRKEINDVRHGQEQSRH